MIMLRNKVSIAFVHSIVLFGTLNSAMTDYCLGISALILLDFTSYNRLA